MHLLLLSPLLAFDDTGLANIGSLFLVVLSVAAVLRKH
jgi:hypothetical protein